MRARSNLLRALCDARMTRLVQRLWTLLGSVLAISCCLMARSLTRAARFLVLLYRLMTLPTPSSYLPVNSGVMSILVSPG